MRICVDAGHGGRDPGVVAHGLREKDVALQHALGLGAELRRRGHVVRLTRDSDTDLAPGLDWPEPAKTYDLNERCRIEQRHGARAFVSIHANASARGDANGAWVLHMNGSVEGRRCAQQVFHRLKQIPGIPDDDPADEVYPDASPATGYTNAANRLLRERPRYVEPVEWLERCGLPRSEWYRRIRVLRGTKSPAVLVELGFLTNTADAQQISTSSVVLRVARAIADGLEAWRWI